MSNKYEIRAPIMADKACRQIVACKPAVSLIEHKSKAFPKISFTFKMQPLTDHFWKKITTNGSPHSYCLNVHANAVSVCDLYNFCSNYSLIKHILLVSNTVGHIFRSTFNGKTNKYLKPKYIGSHYISRSK